MMLFNPIYIQQKGEGEAQVFGKSFPNQKPEYLFSDIIKVSINQFDQGADAPLVNPDDIYNNLLGVSSTNNGLLVSNAKASLAEKLAELKIGLVEIDADFTDNSENSLLLENLLLHLNGADKAEDLTDSVDDVEGIYSTDKSTLIDLANILIANTNINASDKKLQKLIDEFTTEFNELVDSLKNNPAKALKISSGDVSIEIKQASVNSSETSVESEVVEVNSTAKSTGKIEIPAELVSKEKTKAGELSSADAEKLTKDAVDKLVGNNLKNKSAVETENDYSVKISVNESKKSVRKIESTENSELFFKGKVKIEIVNESTNNNVAKAVTAEKSINTLQKETKIKINTDQTSKIQGTGISKAEYGQEIKIDTQGYTNAEHPDKIDMKDGKVALEDVNSLKVELQKKILTSETSDNKNLKPSIDQNNSSNNGSVKVAETNQILGASHEAVTNDKMLKNNKPQQNYDGEKIAFTKEKHVKLGEAGYESEQPKHEFNQQNTFGKTAVQFDKINSFNSELKELPKLVEVTRLVPEIESLIKSGDRKVVTLNLSPENLGSVKVSLDIKDHSVNAKIEVANDSVKQIVLNQAETLKASLTQSGIQLAALNVSVNNQDSKSLAGERMKKKEGTLSDDKKVSIKKGTGKVVVKNLGYNTYDYVA